MRGDYLKITKVFSWQPALSARPTSLLLMPCCLIWYYSYFSFCSCASCLLPFSLLFFSLPFSCFYYHMKMVQADVSWYSRWGVNSNTFAPGGVDCVSTNLARLTTRYEIKSKQKRRKTIIHNKQNNMNEKKTKELIFTKSSE